MMKHALRLPLLLMALFIYSSATYACHCGEYTVNEKVKLSKGIFVGEVIEVKDIGNLQNAIKFRIEKYWKGMADSFVTVISDFPVSCLFGLSAKVGDKYLIYAYDFKGQLATDGCVSAEVGKTQKELKKLGKGNTIIPKRAA